MPEELIDAKLSASEVRADVKFAQVLGRFETQFAGMCGDIKALAATTAAVQASTSGLKSTIIATGIGVVLSVAALLVGMLAYGQTTFYNGTVMRDAVNAAVADRVGSEPRR